MVWGDAVSKLETFVWVLSHLAEKKVFAFVIEYVLPTSKNLIACDGNL